METLTLIIQEAPYTGNNKAWHALRLAGAALAEGMQVRLFLLEQGVEVARRGHRPPEGKTNLEELLAALIGFGLEVHGCGMCLKSCCLPEEELIHGVQRGSMKSLAGWIKTSTHVLSF
jgi:sulfur relay (sulfurtransferase) complex TusBCD TusD component (DsrE family)